MNSTQAVIKNKQMNIALWVLQILLGLWFIIGGLYMINNFENVASGWAYKMLPKMAWIVLGLIQVLLAIALVLPSKLGISHSLHFSAAAGLTVISLLGIVLYAAYTGFPGILWGLIPAILVGFVAYERLN